MLQIQMPASNTVGGVAETQTVVRCDMVKICMLFKGHNSAVMTLINDLNQNSVSSTHMVNACLNYVASFKCLHHILQEEFRK